MSKLTILIDMDDTIENLCEAWVGYLNNKYGTSVSIDDITEWDMSKAFPSLSGQQIYTPLIEDESFWNNVKPLPGAYENICKLIDDGHQVIVVTASHPNSVPLKLNKVLFKYFPFLKYRDVIVTSRKQLIRGDVLVDDAPHNLEGGAYMKILMNAPHNRFFNEESIGAVRAVNWDMVYRLIKQYAYKKEEKYE